MLFGIITIAPSFTRHQQFIRRTNKILLAAILLALPAAAAMAGTLTMQTNIIGPTPTIVGYNHGHYYPGSNTRDWWRYSGVSGARVFFEPSYIEPHVAAAPWGSGVTDQVSFASLKASVRSNPTNNSYFNWAYMTNKYATPGANGSDIIGPTYLASEMQQLGIQVLVESTASASTFTNMSSYGDQWELWLYYYEQAFFLGSQFNVQRYQMYNEPNDASITEADYLTRLKLAADAIQSAVADVNSLYGTSLTARMFAPVTAGTANSTYSTWGELVVTNRHVNYLGQTNASFELLQDYDYHQYGSGGSPSVFGTDLAALQSDLTATMSPETPFPVSISEFNVYDGSQFNGLSTTLDSPVNYSAFGSIAVNLIENNASEMYCFKYSQTYSTYIAKNGMHYVDNNDVPYNTGGITKAGEVWRLINKGFAPGRNRLNFSKDSGASGLDVQASYDPATGRYYLLSVNNTSSSVSLTANFSAWNIPTNNQILVEEVSEVCYGAGTLWTNLGASQTVTGTEGSNTVWLYTVPSLPQQPIQTIAASDDATVTDGANSGINFGSNTNLLVEDNSTNASLRSAALIKFPLPAAPLTNLQLAVLSFNASSANGASTVLAYAYGITNNNWSQDAVTWSTAPNLAQGVAPGTNFPNNFMVGVGDLTNSANGANSAQLVGQLVAGSTPGQRVIDVTTFLRNASGTNVSFLLSRGVRFAGDTQDGDGVSIVSTEGNAALAPHLELVMLPSPAVISNLAVIPRLNSAIITWNTASNATTQLQYGLTPAYGSATTLDTNLVSSHAVLLTGLMAETNYYFQAVSAIGANQLTATGSFFTDPSIILVSAQAQFSGPWTLASAAPGSYTNYYEFANTTNTSDTADAFYTPNIIAAGEYDVSLWYSADSNRSASAPVTVVSSGGSNLVEVNETTNGGSWQPLVGAQNFAAGANGFVRLGNGSGETNRIVIADAVDFAYTQGQDSPTNGTVPAWWSGFYFGANFVNPASPGSNGYSLFANYVIGTSPTNAASQLSFSVSPANGGLQAVFSPWQYGRIYQLQSATNLSAPLWTNLPNLTPAPTTNGQGVILFTNPAVSPAYYRLAISLTP